MRLSEVVDGVDVIVEFFFFFFFLVCVQVEIGERIYCTSPPGRVWSDYPALIYTSPLRTYRQAKMKQKGQK